MAASVRLQLHVANRLPPVEGWIAGIIGDRPSQYAKSPAIWNPAFRALDIEATYVPFDIDPGRLADFVAALRAEERYLGGSVTVPHKVAVLDLLDEVDPMAARIGAVNTIVRTPEGRLVGYNTDGQGALDSLTRGLADGAPFVPDLCSRRVLLIGAGGAARAVAFFLAQAASGGEVLIANRTQAKADELARDVARAFGNARAIPEQRIDDVAEGCDLVVNGTVCGQAGVRSVPGGATIMEPFSALAPAAPPVLAHDADADAFARRWYDTALPAIRDNQARSLERVRRFAQAAFFDLIYAPLETVTLRHARWSGHRTLNGKWMNITQAADAFVYKVCRALLLDGRADLKAVHRRVVDVMAAVW